MATELTSDDLALLVRAAQAAGVNPARLRAANPWSFEGPKAIAIQAAVAELDPACAERLQTDAGVSLSLGAAAALEGLTEWTPELEREVQIKRPDTYRRMEAEAMEAAVERAFGAWNQREAEARELAAQYRYNASALHDAGHHLAARLASQHLEQQRQEQEAQRRKEMAWFRRVN